MNVITGKLLRVERYKVTCSRCWRRYRFVVLGEARWTWEKVYEALLNDGWSSSEVWGMTCWDCAKKYAELGKLPSSNTGVNS